MSPRRTLRDENRWVFDRAVICRQRREFLIAAALSGQSRARQGAGPSPRRTRALSLTFQASMRRRVLVKRVRRSSPQIADR